MSYLVPKNIPSCCAYCSYNHSSLICKITMSGIDRDDEYKERLENCPLIEIKAPHGKLIDADVLKQSAHLEGRVKTYIDTWIDSQRTVIEAERDENEY